MANTYVEHVFGDMCRTHNCYRAIRLYCYKLTATELTAIDEGKEKGAFKESARTAQKL